MTRQSYNYTNRQGVQPISWEDFHGICKALAQAVSSFRPEIILAIGRGGFYPGTLIAHILQADLWPIWVSRRVADIVVHDHPQWLIAPPAGVDGRRVLIVDEICSSGETLLMVRHKAASMGAADVRSAVLYAHTWGTAIPDYIGLITDALIFNPWDREILKDGAFQFHPEYVEALAAQGLAAQPSLLIDATATRLAKGTP